ncbi:hypothetical protein [Limnohabitans sp. Hippo4]|nr:hypothetical protein [Limnohabitans sp. Hippo4]
MEFGIGSIVVIAIYTIIIFQMGKSFGYKAARDDLARMGKLSDTDN